MEHHYQEKNDSPIICWRVAVLVSKQVQIGKDITHAQKWKQNKTHTLLSTAPS